MVVKTKKKLIINQSNNNRKINCCIFITTSEISPNSNTHAIKMNQHTTGIVVYRINAQQLDARIK